MSLADDNIVQENSGVSTGNTSHVVSLGSGTTADNTLLIFTYSGSTFSGTPTGFALDAGGGATTVSVFRKSIIAASETSWTFTTAGAADVAWYVAEVSNLDSVEPLDVTQVGSSASLGNGGTLSTGTTAQTASLSVVSFAIFGALKTSGATLSWDSYTNDYVEASDVSGSSVACLATARKFQNGTTATFSSTGTLTRSDAASSAMARVVAYRAADAPLAAPLALFTGFEFGTHAGMANSASTNNPLSGSAALGTFGTNYLVQGSSARNGSYGLRVVQSGGTGGVLMGTWTDFKSFTFGGNVRVVSGSGTPVVITFDNDNGSGIDLKLVYDVSTTKYGLQWGSGTIQYQSGTTALNTWVWIDIRYRTSTAAYHADWRIETATDTYTDQTSPSDASGSAGVNTNRIVLGGYTTAQTITVDFDDLVASRYYAAYPLQPHKVTVLVPETTGASVSGTSSNFSEFTSNGTLAAFASTSGQRIDEIPPTISASSDGVVQTATASSDYMNFPMTTYTCASDEVIGGVRMLCSEWGGTGTGTGTLGYRGYDGTTETTFVAASSSYDADSQTTASGTYPLWKHSVWTQPTGWTQTKLDAAALRIGFSTDATPDMGISAAYLEVAVRDAITTRQITLDDPISATVDLRVNPYSSASVSYVITNNDATRSVNFNYSISGTPQTPVTVSPSSNQTVTVNMDAFGDISDLSLEPA